jgi:uncharacterized cofD-like protein
MVASLDRPSVVVIGGGSGSSVLLRGLKKQGVKLTSIVTMFDSGGSSGLLREEFGYPPFGDLRQCLMALSDDSDLAETLLAALDFRFAEKSSLSGHNMGNLLLAALTSARKNVQAAVDDVAKMLSVTGDVLPVSLQMADLCAELEDGSLLRGESAIDLRGSHIPPIKRVFLDPAVDANQRAIDAILSADAVVMGPGDLYTSIIPNLLVDRVASAIKESKATKIYVCNLMTKHGETDSFKASDFVSEIVRYTNYSDLDWAIVNTREISRDLLVSYEAEVAEPVEIDEPALGKWVGRIMAAPLSSDDVKVRHDSERLAEVVLSAIELSRSGGSGSIDQGTKMVAHG